jgi:hypothetical protein
VNKSIIVRLSIEQTMLDAALPIFLLFTFARFYFDNSIIFAGISVFLIVYGNYLLLFAITKKPINSLPTIVVALLFGSALCTAVWNKNETLLSIPQFLGNLGFALAALYAQLKPRIFLALFLMLAAFLFMQIINGVDSGSIFTVSRNFISIILIISIAFYYFACAQKNISPSLYVPILGLVLMLWGIGRAGIASGTIILIGTLILSNRRVFTGFIAMAVLAVVFVSSTQSLEKLEGFYVGLERLERMGTDGQRSYINSEYLSRIANHSDELLFGGQLDKIPSVVEVDGNPHNSYIKLHTVFGLIGITLLSVTILTSITRLYILKKRLLLLMLLVTTFRSAFDSTAFHGPLDVAIFFCIFYAIQSKRVVFSYGAENRRGI